MKLAKIQLPAPLDFICPKGSGKNISEGRSLGKVPAFP